MLRAGVVQVPQNHSLFPDMTVEENLDLGGYMLGSRAQVASRRASVQALFPDIGALVRRRRRAACPAVSSGWWSSPAA